LLEGKWSDNQITLDPRSYDWYFGMLTAWGKNEGHDFMRKFSQNKPAGRDGNVLIANLLAAGEFPLAITYAHLIERLRMGGAPVDWVAVKPMIAAPISIALPARPAHPNAANLFMNLVLSKEGSEFYCPWAGCRLGSTSTFRQRLGPRALDLVSLHVSSDEMDPEAFRKILGVR
jgi:iron(III) transport system substrate-binding protein